MAETQRLSESATMHEFPLLDKDFPKNPYPILHRLRSERPVYWFEPLNTWVLTRYEDVTMVLRDHTRFSAQRAERLLAGQLPPEVPEATRTALAQGMSLASMFSDPPIHTLLRSEANRAFSKRAMASFMPKVQSLTDTLLVNHEKNGQMDCFKDFLQPFAITVIADLMGVPRSDVPLLLDWTFKTTLLLGGSKLTAEELHSSMKALEEISSYLLNALQERVRKPKDDMMSFLLAGADLSRFPLQAIAGLCAELIGGANAPTGDALGNALLACLSNPGEVARTREDPTIWSSAVLELLRYDGPVVFWSRIVKEDVTLGGECLRAGDMVYVCLAAANRDPAVFSSPDTLDFTRDNASQHVSFSLGAHHCVGAGLARMEMAIVFQTLFGRMPNLRVSGPITWREGTLSTRGPTSIPVEF